MVRPNRIKEINNSDFTISEFTSNAGGIINAYSTIPINGAIRGVHWLGGNYTATGSVFITLSGTNTSIVNMTSGTVTGQTVNSEWTVYPKANTVLQTGIPISGADGFVDFTEIPANSVIKIAGSGLGSGKSGLGVGITYI